MTSEASTCNTPRFRDTRLDFLRGILILGVVGVHFGGSMVFDKAHLFSRSFWIGLTVNQFFALSVPGFIFFSGYALSMQYETRKIVWSRFVLKRLGKLLPNYIAITLFYFIFLRHSAIVQAVTWDNFLGKLLYHGVDGYLYFVSLIMQLYILFPLIPRTDRWINRYVLKKNEDSLASSVLLLVFFLMVYFFLGGLAYTGRINYYNYCRPFCLFWLVYFYLGFRFHRLMQYASQEKCKRLLFSLALLLTLVFFGVTMWIFTDKTITGPQFDKIPLDFVYARPLTMVFNLFGVLTLGFLLSSSLKFSCNLLQEFGKNSYSIYLWHIIILLYAAWYQPDVMVAARTYPGVFIFMLFLPCYLITLFDKIYQRKKIILRHYILG